MNTSNLKPFMWYAVEEFDESVHPEYDTPSSVYWWDIYERGVYKDDDLDEPVFKNLSNKDAVKLVMRHNAAIDKRLDFEDGKIVSLRANDI